MAQFVRNYATIAPKTLQTAPNLQNPAMPSTSAVLNSIRASGNGLTLAELLSRHPDIFRRTAQRLIAKLIESGQAAALGEGSFYYVFSSCTRLSHGGCGLFYA